MAEREPLDDDDLLRRPKRKHGLSVAERLDRYTRQEGECRVWTAYREPYGYGRMKIKGAMTLVHRAAWEAINGPIPAGLQVLHHCDNPPCCEVSHLFLGTNDDNVADREAKGRGNTHTMREAWRALGYPGLPGSANPKAKLSEEQVRAIRQSSGTQQAIADRLGVSRGLIGHIRRGMIWRHVDG